MKKHRCKDCPPELTRPAPHPGPRCATHHREFRKATAKRNHDNRVQATYGLEPGEYDKLYAAQGGVCAICQRANGTTKRLAVDHDHATGMVRGLLCGPCNQFIGRLRDNAGVLRRAADYLENSEVLA